ncbi:hypothetical protein AB0D57_22675 [Streptomyces sp. NPDC048275]|uniref:hypothetical protein n=1 Tax=Streptomyces sp. NPDC048275 TaxID=3155629 RepID=UPI0033C6897C
MKSLTRRRVLTTGLGLAGGLGLAVTGGTGAAHAAGRSQPSAQTEEWTRKTTANGWAVTGYEGIAPHKVEGSPVTVALRGGAVATVLTYVARRFFYEIDSSLSSEDITGHTSRRDIAAAFESNYLSGTAIAIRPGAYPLGVKDGLFPHEIVVVRDILAECDGVVRWGRDEEVPKESHFQIDLAPGDKRLKALAAKIDQWNRTPGQGAGSVDASLPARRQAARALERRQAR